jgi:carbamoyltransferase
MDLAPYGQPIYAQTIKDHLIDIKPDGSFRLDQSYFDYCTGLTMTSSKFADLFGGPARESEAQITQREIDLAASVQVVIEEVLLMLTAAIAKDTGLKNLCLAGGLALNHVAVGKIQQSGNFNQLWTQPAAGDAGGALGAALLTHYLYKGSPRQGS